MKKAIYTILFLMAATVANATTYYWIGGTSTTSFNAKVQWTTDPVTRTPVGTTGSINFLTTDVLIFDGTNVGALPPVTGAVNILATGSDTIGQLKFINGVNVTIGRATAGSTKYKIDGDGTAAPDFVIDATSTVTLGGSQGSTFNTQISLDTLSATGLVSGTLYISPLSNTVHTQSFINAGPGGLTFATGSSVYISDSSSTSGFSATKIGSIIFESGASLYYYGGRSPIGNNSTTQFTVFKPGSNYYARNTTVTTSSSWTANKTFANVFIQNGSTYTADGTLAKIENLTIDAGCTYVTHTSGQTPVTGNLIVNGTLTGPAAASTNSLVLAGNSPQTVSGTGIITVPNFVVADNSDVTLAKSIVTTGATVNIVGKLNFDTAVISGTATFTSRVAGTANAATGNTVAGSFQITGASALSGNTGLTISGPGIQPNTNVVGFATGLINLSKPATATATGASFTFASGAATLATANPNGFDTLTGCVTVVGTKSFNSGTNYIINAATTHPLGIGTTTNATGVAVGNLTFNASATTNAKVKVAGLLTLNAGKFTIRSSDTVRVLSSGDIAGSPFNSTKYIVTDVSGANSGALRLDSFTAAKLLPIGTAADYLPVTITPSTGSVGFTASVFQGVTADGTPSGTAFTAGQKTNVVDAVWNITRSVGSGNCDISLGWTNGLEGSNFAGFGDAQIGVSRYNAANWTVATASSASSATNTATATYGSFGPFGVGELGAILPVKLINLNAAVNNNKVAISFDALNEVNIEKYIIERSSDARNYNAVGNVIALNNGKEASYHFNDATVATGTYFYRVAIVDRNGKITYSQMLKVAIQTKLSVSVYPNPASNQVVVAGVVKGSTLQIVDVLGKIVATQIVSNQTETINVANLTKGVWFIKITQVDGTVSNSSFIKN